MKLAGDELFELVDERGAVIGVATRAECHRNPALVHRSVHVFVRNSRGDVFLQKRSGNKDIQPGKWDTSVGGHLAPGEDYLAAARRELAEELGLESLAETGPGSLQHSHDSIWRSPVETERIRTFLLCAEGPFRLHPEEIEEGRFWTVSELQDACDGDLFTPNLKQELRLLGLTGHGEAT